MKEADKNSKFISPKDVDVLTVWSIRDEIIEFICQDIDKLFCSTNVVTIINNLLKQEPSIPIWKVLQTKIYNALNTLSFSQSTE